MDGRALSLILLSTLVSFQTSEALTCYVCPLAKKMCTTTNICASDEICMSKRLVLSTGVTWVIGGCENRKICTDSSSTGTRIGKRAQITKTCCQTDYCNGASPTTTTTTTTTTTSTTTTTTTEKVIKFNPFWCFGSSFNWMVQSMNSMAQLVFGK